MQYLQPFRPQTLDLSPPFCSMPCLILHGILLTLHSKLLESLTSFHYFSASTLIQATILDFLKKKKKPKQTAHSPHWSPCWHPGCSGLFSAPHGPGYVKTGDQLLLCSPLLWLMGLAVWLTPHAQLQATFIRACPQCLQSSGENRCQKPESGLAQRKQRCCGHSPQEALRACGLCRPSRALQLEGRWCQSGEVRVARGGC